MRPNARVRTLHLTARLQTAKFVNKQGLCGSQEQPRGGLGLGFSGGDSGLRPQRSSGGFADTSDVVRVRGRTSSPAGRTLGTGMAQPTGPVAGPKPGHLQGSLPTLPPWRRPARSYLRRHGRSAAPSACRRAPLTRPSPSPTASSTAQAPGLAPQRTGGPRS